MITANEIMNMIKKSISDAQVKVEDMTGGGDHFEISVVSAAFKGKLLIDQHRMVQAALEEGLEDGRIHAVKIKTKLPASEIKQSGFNDLNIIG